MVSEFDGYLNIATGKDAEQSSVNNHKVAGYALDGNQSTSTITRRNKPLQWWRVDLGDEYFIEAMVFHVPPPADGKEKR